MTPSIVSIITIQTAESELLGVSNIKEWSLAPPGGGGGRGKTGGEKHGGKKATAIMVKLGYRLSGSGFIDQVDIRGSEINFIHKDLHDH